MRETPRVNLTHASLDIAAILLGMVSLWQPTEIKDERERGREPSQVGTHYETHAGPNRDYGDGDDFSTTVGQD